MPSADIEKLLKLQETDRRIQQHAIEAKEIPRRIKKIRSKLSVQEQLTEQAREKHTRCQVQIKEIEVDVDLSREKANRYKRQQMEVKDNESYRALDNEIRGLKRHIDRQDERGIGLVISMEEAKEALDKQEAILGEQTTAVDAEKETLKERDADLQSSIQAIEVGRDALTEGIDSEWLSRYERTFRHTGDFALVESNGGKCGGCNMKLPPSVVLDSKKGEKISTCNYCGRMLYFRLS